MVKSVALLVSYYLKTLAMLWKIRPAKGTTFSVKQKSNAKFILNGLDTHTDLIV